jgi:hypothetical protein
MSFAKDESVRDRLTVLVWELKKLDAWERGEPEVYPKEDK